MGTAASFAADMGIIARDVYNELYATPEDKYPFDTDMKQLGPVFQERLDAIMKEVKEMAFGKSTPDNKTVTPAPVTEKTGKQTSTQSSPTNNALSALWLNDNLRQYALSHIGISPKQWQSLSDLFRYDAIE